MVHQKSYSFYRLCLNDVVPSLWWLKSNTHWRGDGKMFASFFTPYAELSVVVFWTCCSPSCKRKNRDFVIKCSWTKRSVWTSTCSTPFVPPPFNLPRGARRKRGLRPRRGGPRSSPPPFSCGPPPSSFSSRGRRGGPPGPPPPRPPRLLRLPRKKRLWPRYWPPLPRPFSSPLLSTAPSPSPPPPALSWRGRRPPPPYAL